MKKLKFHKTFAILTIVFGIALMIASCRPNYMRGDYGNRRPNYGNGHGRFYSYARPPLVVPRYGPPPRRGYYGKGNSRGRRW